MFDQLRRAWNAFRDDDRYVSEVSPGPSYSVKPDRARLRSYPDRSIVTSIITKIAVDVSDVVIRHTKVDDLDRFTAMVESKLDHALRFEPNLDQGPRQFRQDIAATLLDKGVAAIVPVDMTIHPKTGELLDIHTLRVGTITDWHPKHVKVDLYNEAKGIHQEVLVEKAVTGIVENPMFAVMNAPNATLQRLLRKFNLLDMADEESASGKLDIIIQLPYVIKSDTRRQQAEQRRTEIEMQLKSSSHGIAYTDGTEKITQLNRPVENNLLPQIERLMKSLYTELGLTEEVMNGTADEAAMLNYYHRTVEPIATSIIEAMQRTFLRGQPTSEGERIQYFRDPFRFVPVGQIAEIADKFTRNKILTGNEIRGYMGIPPSPDETADQLQNPNMPAEAPSPVYITQPSAPEQTP
jgi:hypothetical protein